MESSFRGRDVDSASPSAGIDIRIIWGNSDASSRPSSTLHGIGRRPGPRAPPRPAARVDRAMPVPPSAADAHAVDTHERSEAGLRARPPTRGVLGLDGARGASHAGLSQTLEDPYVERGP